MRLKPIPNPELELSWYMTVTQKWRKKLTQSLKEEKALSVQGLVIWATVIPSVKERALGVGLWCPQEQYQGFWTRECLGYHLGSRELLRPIKERDPSEQNPDRTAKVPQMCIWVLQKIRAIEYTYSHKGYLLECFTRSQFKKSHKVVCQQLEIKGNQ